MNKTIGTKEISINTNSCVKTVYEHVRKLKIKPYKRTFKGMEFNNEQYQIIKNSILKTTEVIKYYPIKTTETYYIYESKMNYGL
jgi:hypothetical protein